MILADSLSTLNMEMFKRDVESAYAQFILFIQIRIAFPVSKRPICAKNVAIHMKKIGLANGFLAVSDSFC